MVKHVLFVDDDLLTHKVIALYLRNLVAVQSVQLYFAASVAEAKVILESERGGLISMVFTDINMPQANGFELLRFVKRHYIEKKVYMLTGHDCQQYCDKANALGSDGFFTKPLNVASLVELLQ